MKPDPAPFPTGTALRRLSLEQVALAYARMGSRLARQGDVIVKQGDPAFLYYLLESGTAEVRRRDPASGLERCVAELGPGHVFGEEALMLNGFRNATVVMTSNGRIWSLKKDDFDALVRPALVKTITPARARERVRQGTAKWLDCRYEIEFAQRRLPGATLIPLDRLRDLCHVLDTETTYIVYCQNGRRSECATYLLKEKGIDALLLDGGLSAWPYETRTRPRDFEAPMLD